MPWMPWADAHPGAFALLLITGVTVALYGGAWLVTRIQRWLARELLEELRPLSKGRRPR